MALLKRSEQLMMICVGGISFLLSLLSLVLEPFDLAQGVREHIPQASLLLLSSFVLYFASRERLTSEFAKWKGLGITDIYTSRTEVGQFDAYYQILNSAKNELFIVGITQKNIAREHAQLLVRKASRGCSIDLLVSEPTLLMSLEDTGVHEGLRLDFCRAVAGLRTLAIQVARAGAAGNLEVRFSRKVPTICLTVADGNAAGAMRIELLPYNSHRHSQFQPVIDVRRFSANDWLSNFYAHYRDLWEGSQAYIRVRSSMVEVNERLDGEICGTFGMAEDWLPPDLKVREEKPIVSH